jgi:hypothetical protein
LEAFLKKKKKTVGISGLARLSNKDRPVILRGRASGRCVEGQTVAGREEIGSQQYGRHAAVQRICQLPKKLT